MRFLLKVEFRPQLVQDRLFQSGNDRFVRPEQIEDHDFIPAGLQPGTGQIHGLLRTDIPETPEVVAIDPYEPFTPGSQVEESVMRFGDVE